MALPARPGGRRWNWRLSIRIAWLVFALALLVILIANIPTFFQYASVVCSLSDVGNCPAEQFTPAYVQVLKQLHLAVALAQGGLATLCVTVCVLYYLLGLWIFWRRSQSRMALFVSLLFVVFGSTGLLSFNLPAQTPSLFLLLTQYIGLGLMWPAMLVFFFIFPTGHFTPRWTWAVFVPFFVVTMLTSFPATAPLVPGVVLFLATLLPIVVQIYRYVRVYNAVQQQQLKWFAFGLSIAFLLVLIQGILQARLADSPEVVFWYQLFNGPFWLVLWLLLLPSIGIPILRYRLWDIDTIINRALLYSSLSILLVALYVGLILASQALVHSISGSSSQPPLVVVVSTLLIAALFQPLRHRLQSMIDRRFYRRKYDAAKVMATFGRALHNEVDLVRLRERLIVVVYETMQPSHVSLWLCPPTRTKASPLSPDDRLSPEKKLAEKGSPLVTMEN